MLNKVGNSVLLSGHENCYQGHLTPWVMEVADRWCHNDIILWKKSHSFLEYSFLNTELNAQLLKKEIFYLFNKLSLSFPNVRWINLLREWSFLCKVTDSPLYLWRQRKYLTFCLLVAAVWWFWIKSNSGRLNSFLFSLD